jgi:hypothetical protein
MSAKKRITRKELDAIERAAKRKAQKEAGALDGRFREKVVPSKKRYERKSRGGKDAAEDGA